MKIFISWSGEKSHKVACALRDWLPYVIQTLKPFISSGDIPKGERWSNMLGKELEDTKFGIICLTPYNIKSPWLNFEAGALSKFVERSFLAPFLFQVEPSEVIGPLSQFQTTIYKKEDVFDLLSSINDMLEDEIRLEIELLISTFDMWWPKLEAKLDDLKHEPEVETETGYQWLHSPGEIAKIESDNKCNEIWVITPSPDEDLDNACVFSSGLVKNNILRGVKYIVICPLSNTTPDILMNLFKGHSDQLKIHDKLDADQFQNLAVTHYLVLKPENEDADNPLRIFFKLPIKERDYWIEAGEGFAGIMVARIRRMVPELNA